MPGSHDLETALAQGLAPGGDLAAALRERGPRPLTTDDAAALVQALSGLTAAGARRLGGPNPAGRLHLLAALVQPGDPAVLDALRAGAAAPLLRLHDQEKARADGDDQNVLALLRALAVLRNRRGLQRLVAAARDPRFSGRYLWSSVFAAFDADHPLRHECCDELRNPLPEGFTAVAYLDFVNQLAIRGELGEHPFDSPPGRAALHAWLTGPDPAAYSYAVSATVAAPFVSSPDREQLLALALDHPSTDVQMEAAWASARLGSRGGVKCLARLCLDPRTSATACAYLRELDRDDDVPPDALAPDFLAQAELCRWLAHPREFGRPPDEVELFDTRELDWPPTNDRRRLWLVRYRYAAPGHPAQEGLGMVGSITFALFGETSTARPPEDAYALHCCWELDYLGDLRAPDRRSVPAGRKLLGL